MRPDALAEPEEHRTHRQVALEFLDSLPLPPPLSTTKVGTTAPKRPPAYRKTTSTPAGKNPPKNPKSELRKSG